MNLLINGVNYGMVESYQQDRIKKTWVFKMGNGIEISCYFSNIKIFNSTGSLEIFLH